MLYYFFELMGHNQLISCPWMRDKIMLLPIFEPRLGCVHTDYVNKFDIIDNETFDQIQEKEIQILVIRSLNVANVAFEIKI